MGRSHSISVLLAAITSMLVILLVSVFAVLATQAFKRQQSAQHTLAVVDVVLEMLSAAQDIRNEGGLEYTTLTVPEAASPETIKQISVLHAKADDAIKALFRHLRRQRPVDETFIAGVEKLWNSYRRLHPAVLDAAKQPIAMRPEALNRQRAPMATDIVAVLNTQATTLSNNISNTDAFVSEMMNIYEIAWLARTNTGYDRNGVQRAILAGTVPSAEDTQRFVDLAGRIDAPWSLIEADTEQPYLPAQIKQAIKNTNEVYFKRFRAIRKDVLDHLAAGRKVAMTGQEWSRLTAPGMDAFVLVSKTALDLTRTHALEQVTIASRNLYVAIGLMISSIGLACFSALYVMRRVVAPLTRITRAMHGVGEKSLAGSTPFENRKDEIGQFARALRLFHDSILERERLKELVASRDRLLADMSHELRSPLTRLQLAIALARQSPEKVSQSLDRVGREADKLEAMVSEILALSKLESGVKTSDEYFFVSEIARIVVDDARFEAQEKGVAIDLLDCQKDHEALVVGSGKLVGRAIENIVRNALRFSRRGDTVTLEMESGAAGSTLFIRDEGPGVKVGQIDSLFEPFVQGDTTSGQGYGLGLSIAKRAILAHGGTIQASNGIKGGLVIRLWMPAAPDAPRGSDYCPPVGEPSVSPA
jgi:two-component system OmpR family sensor kinase